MFRLLAFCSTVDVCGQAQLPKQSEGQLIVLSWIKQHERNGSHHILQIAEQAAGSEQRIHASDTGHQDKFVLVRPSRFTKDRCELLRMEGASQR